MTESAPAVFDRLAAAVPPQSADVLLDTACVLGGSIAGLLAARVLADRSDRVVVFERDPAGTGRGVSAGARRGVPQEQHVHVLAPGGLEWMERWLPGLTKELQNGGAALAHASRVASYLDGHRQAATDHELIFASRRFIEASVRAKVLGLPNVSVLQAQATGLEYQDGAVSGVRYTAAGEGSGLLAAGIVVDAMGRGSRLTDWLATDGWDRPEVQRLPTAVNYASALLRRERSQDELLFAGARAICGPPLPAGGVAVAAASAIEGDRWLVMVMGYDDDHPGRTLEGLRASCSELPPPFPEAVSGDLVAEIATYHQADSRRRDFALLRNFPARLVSVGDAVASFNPIYGQGMAVAALQASALAEYLSGQPDLNVPATGFFELQNVVVDAAWAMSAGGDAARLDAVSGAEVPEEVSKQRSALDQILRATLADVDVCRAFEKVAFLLAHPATLADPAILEQAITVNRRNQA